MNPREGMNLAIRILEDSREKHYVLTKSGKNAWREYHRMAKPSYRERITTVV